MNNENIEKYENNENKNFDLPLQLSNQKNEIPFEPERLSDLTFKKY